MNFKEKIPCLEEMESLVLKLKIDAGKIHKHRELYDAYRDKNSDKELGNLSGLHKSVNALQTHFGEAIRLLHEIDYDDLTEKAGKLFAIIKRYNYIKSDCKKLCMAIFDFADVLKENFCNEDEDSPQNPENGINRAALGRLMNRVKMGYFPTDPSHVAKIKNALVFPENTANILDPCCGCGMALELLCEDRNALSYGIEIDRARAEQAEQRLHRVGYGSYFHSQISNGTFHAVFLNPPYLAVMSSFGKSVRAERLFLSDAIRQLMINGVFIYIIPFYRMTEDICRYLAECLYEINVYRFSESEFKKFRQVVVIGKKRKCRTSLDSDVSGSVRESIKTMTGYSFDAQSIVSIDNLVPQSYALPDVDTAVNRFRGAEFNVKELEAQLAGSNSIKLLFDKSKLDNMQRNPLLPLKIGQIGLIGGSGLMNGLIECDTPHIIKGRIVKQKSTEQNADKKRGRSCPQGIIETREVISNKMIFNVLTPEGLKSLA